MHTNFQNNAVKISGFEVKTENLGKFKEVILSTNARFSRNPYFLPDGTGVFQFEFSDVLDYNEFNHRWKTMTTPIKEVRSDRTVNKILRKIGFR